MRVDKAGQYEAAVAIYLACVRIVADQAFVAGSEHAAVIIEREGREFDDAIVGRSVAGHVVNDGIGRRDGRKHGAGQQHDSSEYAMDLGVQRALTCVMR